MIRLLPSVKLTNVAPQIVFAVTIADQVWKKWGADVLWVTSVQDSEHKVGSQHYLGLAADLRVKNLPRTVWENAAAELQAAVGPEYDVLLELDPPHVHVEYDPTHLNR